MKSKMKVLVLLTLFTVCFFVHVNGVCQRVMARGVDTNQQNIAIQEHNKLRLMVAQGQVKGQPKAANMKKMIWDSALANKAQEIADTCIFAHVDVDDPRFSWVGQNLYITFSSSNNGGPDWPAALKSWFSEHSMYTYSNRFQPDAGHYTQVVWAKSTRVGCGYTHQLKNGRHEKFYVCNYAPGGNIFGEFPYEIGKGCENLC